MFDVGQAECFLLQKGHINALIDCGNITQGKNIVQKLKTQGITQINYVFATHPHEDHMGGMYDIITNFEIGKIILPYTAQKEVKTKWYKKLMNKIVKGNYQLEVAQPKVIYNLEGVEIKVISDT